MAWRIGYSNYSDFHRFAAAHRSESYHVSQVNLLQILFPLHHALTQGPLKSPNHPAIKTPLLIPTPPIIYLFWSGWTIFVQLNLQLIPENVAFLQLTLSPSSSSLSQAL